MKKSKVRFEKYALSSGRTIRFTNFVDEESQAFEAEADFLSEASAEQTTRFLKCTKREFYLMQIRSVDGKPAAQFCVYIGRPRWVSFFGMATIPNLSLARNEEEEAFGLDLLRNWCAEIPGVMSLRLQPKRYEKSALSIFRQKASQGRYEPVSPLGPVRTLVLDLEENAEDLVKKLPQKVRAKFRHPGRDRVELRSLTDPAWISTCRAATNASRNRSGGTETTYDFETAFAMAQSEPKNARVIGLFLKDRPQELLAYVIGFRNGLRCEYASAGSVNDPVLRSLPFNYFLLGELTHWARQEGSRWIDLGGVTEGGPEDPLQGISRFKRSLCQNEFEIGSEMATTLNPVSLLIYQTVKKVAAR